MKVIIQCAALKRKPARTLKTLCGESVKFVAVPEQTSSGGAGELCVRPDDYIGERGITWREELVRYNAESANPERLFSAAELYAPNEHEFRHLYRELADMFGWGNVFVLSAGWGLIRSDFRTPDYDITFADPARKKKPWAWRNMKDLGRRWLDFNHLQDAQICQDEPIHFFGGQDYRPLLYALVTGLPGEKFVHYKGNVDRRSGFEYLEYKGPEKNRTWHYRAAKEFLAVSGR